MDKISDTGLLQILRSPHKYYSLFNGETFSDADLASELLQARKELAEMRRCSIEGIAELIKQVQLVNVTDDFDHVQGDTLLKAAQEYCILEWVLTASSEGLKAVGLQFSLPPKDGEG